MVILQLSDVHLDCAFSGVLDQGVRDRLRAAQREVFREAVTGCPDADLVLLPGDLFEHDRVELDTVRFMQGVFESVAPTPVFIAPGNHDPCVRGSYYLTVPWPKNVTVFACSAFESRPLSDGRATVFGIANSGTADSVRPLDNFRADGDGLKIGLIHGTCIDSVPEGFLSFHCLPFTSQNLSRAGFDYVALGHFHSFTRFPASGRTVACYSGSLHHTGFGASGDKGSLIVRVEPGETDIQFNRIEYPSFHTIELDLGLIEQSEQVVEAVRSVSESRNLSEDLVRVRLRGEIDPALDLRLDDVQQRTADRFLYLSLDGSELTVGYDFEHIAAQDNVMGRLVRNTSEQLDNLSPDSRKRRVLERARLYALDALSGREVRQS